MIFADWNLCRGLRWAKHKLHLQDDGRINWVDANSTIRTEKRRTGKRVSFTEPLQSLVQAKIKTGKTDFSISFLVLHVSRKN